MLTYWINKRLILDVGGAIQQTTKRKNYKLQNEDGTHNSNAYYTSGYKSNILQLIYAEAGEQINLQSASLYQ
ncbi:MAG TPA: hypothetical protein VD694_03965 [Nitrososphaeraceae archaeon]|nr:hypothetical protein [Nitrososphaeraceae archaeon]